MKLARSHNLGPHARTYYAEQQEASFSYPQVGASLADKVPDYDNDHNSIPLGKGDWVWEKAKEMLQNWQHFPPSWTKTFPQHAPLEEGQTIIVAFRLWGLWWLNSTRIVYTFDEPTRFGFAYGTLEGHIEQGEECFWLERDAEGVISYHIKAFSKPAFWGARLTYPLPRRFQARFVKDSFSCVQGHTSQTPQKNNLL